ncbi:HU family DNA-binding protein [Fusobacterium ulcerans]|jgi:nucleoid DNA-binding protein|uniref:HU family DNA-binding protein n=1 Tax=Fusobacterium ulcerans TaxID=861 RepID=UPI00241F4763|nr:HU family DNA-binding protein [Fusobacterium ulcerans]
MNKREMAKLYTKMNPEMLSIIKAENEIEEFLETVKEAIVIDGKVKFPKIGTFEILTRKSRIVANPVTKEQMTIYPKKIIKFRASKKIK